MRVDRLEWLAQLCAGVALCVLALELAAQPAPAAPAPPAPPGAPAAVVRYRLEARLDAEQHHVYGKGEVVWRNTSRQAQREIWLHLYLNAFRDEDSVFMRKRDRGFRGGARPSRWGGIDVEKIVARELGVDLWQGAEHTTPGDADDATDIRLPLPRPVAPGEALTLELAWVSRLPSVVLRTGFAGSFHMVAQWFPKIARLEEDGTWAHFPFHRLSEFYADFGDYEVTIDVPASFRVGATGVEVARREVDGRLLLTHAQRGVHDFAFAAWDGFDEKSEVSGGVALRCLYPRGEHAVAALELAEVKAALAQYGAAYGAYPYASLTIVHPPETAREAGGMEYPTLITTGGPSWAPLVGARTLEVVTAHELAHQWFYGLLASNEHRYPFLDEGLTTFASHQALEERYPSASAFEGLGWTLSLHALARAAAARSWDRGAVARASADFDSGRDYGDLVYSRAATLLETLARVYGRPRLAAALGAYARAARFSHPSPADLLAAIAAHVGAEAADNARRCLIEGGGVDYRADEPSGSEVVVRREGALLFPVEIEVRLADGSRRRSRWDGQGERWSVDAGGEVDAVVVDPDLAVLLDHDLANNARRRGGPLLAPRILAQGAFLGHLGAMVIAP
jgi:hypothetical protein